MGADIINLSWGNSSYWESNEVVINTVYSEYGCILVGAAGNDGVYEPHYPAAYENVISRKVGHSKNTDIVMSQVFWLGVTPLLTGEQLKYITESISKLISQACV